MGSGSSALTDALTIFDNTIAPHDDFEYIFLHFPNGVFDLENKLLNNNNAIRSDEALRSFRITMAELFNNRLWWAGNYRNKLSKNFLKITDAYIESLTQFKSDSYWYYQEKRGASILPKLIINRLLKKEVIKTPLKYNKMILSIPAKEEFYSKSRAYLESLLLELGINQHNLILDQLLLPFNAWKMNDYFDNNAVCFIVDRDPRDVFISNKYIWLKQGTPVPYPLDVFEFCEFYKKIRSTEHNVSCNGVYRLHFEDLIYKKAETFDFIQATLDIKRSDTDRASKFDPQTSINNTQLFNLPEFTNESSIIESELTDYLYHFPFNRLPDSSIVF